VNVMKISFVYHSTAVIFFNIVNNSLSIKDVLLS